MNTRSTVMLTALMMLFSSMAGCLDLDEDDEWTAMVSTYHVGQLVSAIGGDTIKVEMMSASNVPVHDFEPAAADKVRLQESDIFFYHGLNLEPWVATTLSSLGDDAPTSVQTHAMPTGETTLDYESMLIADLCELLSEGPYESTSLAMGEEEQHDDHENHDNDSHENHSDEESAHEGHEHAEAEETIENPEGCPADTVISIFHMEEGEHVLEFEEDHHEDFNMAVLKMLGGHAHHHHDDHDEEEGHEDHDNSTETDEDHDDHDEHGDDDHDGGFCHNTTTHENYESTEADCEAAGHMWKEDGDHDDHQGGFCHNTTTHENYESTEADCEAAGHVWMEEEAHDYPEIHAEYVAHGLSFPEEMVCYDISSHTVNISLVSQADCEAAGLMWTASDSGPEDDDDHSDEEEHHEAGYAVIHIEEEGDYGFAMPKGVEFHILEGDHEGHDGHDGHGDEEDGHGDEEDGHDEEGEIEAHDDEEEFDFDPHSWLDPLAFKEQAKVVLEALKVAYPSGESAFTTNAEAFMLELDNLHADFQANLPSDSTCTDTKVVANHNAYSYMAKRYGLQFISIHGIDPEGEPAAADILEAVEEINEGGITVLFVEEFTSISAVDSIVEQTVSESMPDGVAVEYLYTMEMAPRDSSDDYISLMRKNMQNLKEGLGC